MWCPAPFVLSYYNFLSVLDIQARLQVLCAVAFHLSADAVDLAVGVVRLAVYLCYASRMLLSDILYDVLAAALVCAHLQVSVCLDILEIDSLWCAGA